MRGLLTVGRDGAKLTGAIPQDLATTGRTWACMSRKHLTFDADSFTFYRNLDY